MTYLPGRRTLACAIGALTLFASAAAPAAAQVRPQATMSAAGAATTPAANLRIALDELLGAHAVLVQLAMQEDYAGSAQYAGTAAALNDNTNQLAAAIGSVYGMKAQIAFRQMWTAHIGYFLDYAKATKAGDAAGQAAALRDLAQYKRQFAAFLAGADPKVDATTVSAALQVHVNEVVATLRAYVAGNQTLTAKDFVAAYDHMFVTGDYLSGAIAAQFPAKFGTTGVGTPAVNLRATLDQLLGAHAVLAILALEQGYDGAAGFSATAGELGQNAAAITAAVASVYGAKAGELFGALWTAHIGYFVDFMQAKKAKDAAGVAKARVDLAGYGTNFATLMHTANPAFSEAVIEMASATHVHQLTSTLDAYAQGQYAKAALGLDFSYDHMFVIGDYLSEGIVAQFPSKFGA